MAIVTAILSSLTSVDAVTAAASTAPYCKEYAKEKGSRSVHYSCTAGHTKATAKTASGTNGSPAPLQQRQQQPSRQRSRPAALVPAAKEAMGGLSTGGGGIGEQFGVKFRPDSLGAQTIRKENLARERLSTRYDGSIIKERTDGRTGADAALPAWWLIRTIGEAATPQQQRGPSADDNSARTVFAAVLVAAVTLHCVNSRALAKVSSLLMPLTRTVGPKRGVLAQPGADDAASRSDDTQDKGRTRTGGRLGDPPRRCSHAALRKATKCPRTWPLKIVAMFPSLECNWKRAARSKRRRNTINRLGDNKATESFTSGFIAAISIEPRHFQPGVGWDALHFAKYNGRQELQERRRCRRRGSRQRKRRRCCLSRALTDDRKSHDPARCVGTAACLPSTPAIPSLHADGHCALLDDCPSRTRPSLLRIIAAACARCYGTVTNSCAVRTETKMANGSFNVYGSEGPSDADYDDGFGVGFFSDDDSEQLPDDECWPANDPDEWDDGPPQAVGIDNYDDILAECSDSDGGETVTRIAEDYGPSPPADDPDRWGSHPAGPAG